MRIPPNGPSHAVLLDRYERLRHVAEQIRDLPPSRARACLAGAANELLGAGGTEEVRCAPGAAGPAWWEHMDPLGGSSFAYLQDLYAALSCPPAPSPQGPDAIWLGCHPAIRAIGDRLGELGRPGFPALVMGERGTGKGQLVRAVHVRRGGAPDDLCVLSCAGLPEQLVESQLFGHEKGSFTGAGRRRPGLLLTAHRSGGTLLLDDLGEFPERVQVELLQALEEGTFLPVGSDRPVSIGRRQERQMKICATSQPTALSGVRRDLLDRLCTLPVWLPPLRDRGLDILYLADLELEALARRGQGEKRLSREGRELLLECRWPGNVRQLQNVIRSAVVRSGGAAVLESGLLLRCVEESEWVEACARVDDEQGDAATQVFEASKACRSSEARAVAAGVPRDGLVKKLRGRGAGVPRTYASDGDPFPTLDQVVVRHMKAALARTDGNVSEAARMLRISRSTIYARLPSLVERTG